MLTWDPANVGTDILLSAPPWDTQSNTLAKKTASNNNWNTVLGNTFQSAGLFYHELIISIPNTNAGVIWGYAASGASVLATYLGNAANTGGNQTNGSRPSGSGGLTGTSQAGTLSTVKVHVVGIATDVTNKRHWARYYSTGDAAGRTWLAGDPIAATSPGTWAFAGAVCPAVSINALPAVSPTVPWTGLVYVNGGQLPWCQKFLNPGPPAGYAAWGGVGSVSPGNAATKTFDPNAVNGNVALSNGNLTANNAISGGFNVFYPNLIMQPLLADTYFEATCNSVGADNAGFCGIAPPFVENWSNGGLWFDGIGWSSNGGLYIDGAITAAGLPTYAAGDVLRWAVSPSSKKTWMAKNAGAWQSGNPALYTGGQDYTAQAGEMFGWLHPYVAVTHNSQFTVNMGATAFAYASPWAGVAAPSAARFLLGA